MYSFCFVTKKKKKKKTNNGVIPRLHKARQEIHKKGEKRKPSRGMGKDKRYEWTVPRNSYDPQLCEHMFKLSRIIETKMKTSMR